MKKILFVMVVMLGLGFIEASLNSLFAATYKSDMMSIYLKGGQSSRVWGETDEVDTMLKKRFDVGVGISFDGLRMDWSRFTSTSPGSQGSRVSLSYDFFAGRPVNVYMGVNTLVGFKYYDKEIKRSASGMEPHVGFSFGITRFVRPYVEFNIIRSYFMFGLTVHVYKEFERKNIYSPVDSK